MSNIRKAMELLILSETINENMSIKEIKERIHHIKEMGYGDDEYNKAKEEELKELTELLARLEKENKAKQMKHRYAYRGPVFKGQFTKILVEIYTMAEDKRTAINNIEYRLKKKYGYNIDIDKSRVLKDD